MASEIFQMAGYFPDNPMIPQIIWQISSHLENLIILIFLVSDLQITYIFMVFYLKFFLNGILFQILNRWYKFLLCFTHLIIPKDILIIWFSTDECLSDWKTDEYLNECIGCNHRAVIKHGFFQLIDKEITSCLVLIFLLIRCDDGTPVNLFSFRSNTAIMTAILSS